MKKILFITLCCLFFPGCATIPLKTLTPEDIPEGTAQWHYGNLVFNNYVVEFISEPQDIKIEINNEYIGNTPIKRVWHGSYGGNTYYIIKAYPKYPGQYVQTKFVEIDKLPRKVYFQMNLGPSTPEFDVNIK